MGGPYAALLDKTRLPQPSLQRFAVVSLFRHLESSPGALGPASTTCLEAISQCLRSHSAAVVDQAVREICRLVASGHRLPISDALIELQSALEGCERHFVPVFVKGIGFLCRIAFRTDPSWGRHFGRVELHPFVKVLTCCGESHEELIQQVLLFIARNKSLGFDEVLRFLRPFIMYTVIWKSSACEYFFSRNLISAIASLSCSFPLEAINILKLLTECLKYLPLTNEEEFIYIVSSAVHLVDAYVVVLKQTVGTEKEVTSDVQRCSVEVLSMLLSFCAYFQRKPQGHVEAIVEISRNLLVAHKELGLSYSFEFVDIFVSASVILSHVEFEYDQLCVLKLLILLLEWKTDLSAKRASYSFSEVLLIIFPATSLLSSPSKSVKAMATRLLALADHFLLDFKGDFEEDISCTDFPVLIETESIPLRLLRHLFTQGRYSLYCSYVSMFTSDKVPCVEMKYSGPLCWASCLKDFLLAIEKANTKFLHPLSENLFEGVLLSSIAFSLVICPAFNTSALNFLTTLGMQDPKLSMAMFQVTLFYINTLFKVERDSSKVLLSILEMLPSLASHSSMLQLIVQTILSMLHHDEKPSLHAVGIRLLCKTWVVSDRVFENLQGVLSPKVLSNFESEREVCLSVAASIRDVCKHNPDRGVDLILSVSSCIESKDSIIKALGLQSLSSLCEADVVDFYTAWEVIAKHINSYSEDPIVAAGLVTLLQWGAMDVEAYPDVARNVLLILWQVGTFRSHSFEPLWVKARSIAFKSMMHYEIVKFQEFIPEFMEKNLNCLLNEYNAEVLEAMEEFEIKIISFEHINRRRTIKERRPLSYKIEKLLDAFPQALFFSGTGNHNLSPREFPGAALLSDGLNFKKLWGLTNEVPRVHAAFEMALIEIAQSLPLSRNIFIALLALESWKAFVQNWMKALVTTTDAKGSSIKLDDSLSSSGNILKICCKVAMESVPQVSTNATLAIGALCLVVPSSYAITSSASDFLLKRLLEYEHEHQQWSSAISLGLISNCFHATDRKQKINVITSLMKVACNSKSHLVIGACGLGLGFACQGLLSSADVDSIRHTEATLLRDLIRTLSLLLSKLCPYASDSLKNFNVCFLVDGYDSIEAFSLLPQWNLDNLGEEDIWGVAGLVLGLGNSVVGLYRLGVNDALLSLKDALLSWLPSLESSNQRSFFCNKMTEMPLAVGACLAIPIVVAYCQNAELMLDDFDAILFRYVSLVSELLNSKEFGVHYQNLLMASCIGVGSFVSCILSNGMHSIRYNDIKHLLEVLRSIYLKSHLPLVQFGGMIGVVNSFGAAVGDVTYKHLQPSFLPVSLDLQGSDFVRGPILLSPICASLSTSLVHELFLVAKEPKELQIRKYAAWAFSFLRHKWYLENFWEIDCSQSISKATTLQSQSLAEDSLVWKMCSWVSNINFNQVHSSTAAAVLRCLSKAPRLPVLEWASIIRGFMANAANFTDKTHKLQGATSFREECIKFSLSHAKNVKSLLLFLDDITDLSRFRKLELNLQCLLLGHVLDLMNTFSALRMERLFQDYSLFFSSSTSPYFGYGSTQKVLLRISFWKGLYQCLNGASIESSCASKIEKCLECLFHVLPTFVYNVKSEEWQSTCSEWFEAIRCLAKAPHDWLLKILQISDCSTLTEIVIRILAKVRLVKDGWLPSSELDKLKSFILNFKLEGIWWSILVELVAALTIVEVSIKGQWLLDALDISVVSENPSTAISFIGLLSGSCCKYMPLLIVDPEIVLADLPVTLPSLLSSNSWSSIAESVADKLWLSTERICTRAVILLGGANTEIPNLDIIINETDVQASICLARTMHRTCLSLKDYLSLDKRLSLANLQLP